MQTQLSKFSNSSSPFLAGIGQKAMLPTASVSCNLLEGFQSLPASMYDVCLFLSTGVLAAKGVQVWVSLQGSCQVQRGSLQAAAAASTWKWG